MNTLKNEIKDLVEVQKELKNQRKTDRLVGERTMPAWEASLKHLVNRHTLRLMYAAYGKMRGKSYSQTENHHDEETHPLKQYERQIDAIIEKYGKEVVHPN